MKIITLILARGGSIGIPKKNLMHINGFPLIYYPIKASLNCKDIQRTIVSTEDDEISRVSVDYGAEVPFKRPIELSKNESLDIDCFIHALEYLDREENYRPDLIVHLRPTVPLVTPDNISDAISILNCDPKADCIRSVNSVERTPYKMWIMDKNYIIPILNDKYTNSPRQLLPKVYDHNGYVDVIRYKTIMEKRSMCGKTILPYIINTKHLFDIDDPTDLEDIREYFRSRK